MSADIQFTGPKGAENDNTAAMFVSLYVVILAFFILLTSNAQFDVKKSRNVMDSVNKAFAKDPSIDNEFTDPNFGAEISITQFFESIKTTVASIIPLYEMDIVTDGRVMRLTMPIDALFYDNDPELRSNRGAFYERLMGSLNQWKPYSTVNLTFQHGIVRPKANTPEAASLLEVARLGNFARFVENNGADPQYLTIGLDPTIPEKISFTFTVLELHPAKGTSRTIVEQPAKKEEKQ